MATDLRDDKNLPATVITLLDQGRAVLAAEQRRQREADHARRSARLAAIHENARVAAAELVKLCPEIARIMPFVKVQDDSDADRPGGDFRGLTFIVAVPGFAEVKVTCGKTPDLGKWPGGWNLSEFRVTVLEGTTAHPTLAIALAKAREEYLRTTGSHVVHRPTEAVAVQCRCGGLCDSGRPCPMAE